MIGDKVLAQRLLAVREYLRQHSPLIHCITNPISINDCANVVLAVGAQPVMAEHPREAAAITAAAGALVVNLGNITDVRMESMLLSGQCAYERGIPIVLDLVGVTCSPLRAAYAQSFIRKCRPTVIKGNVSEIRFICGLDNHAIGVDAGAADGLTLANRAWYAEKFGRFARQQHALLLASGALDLVTDGETSWLAANGSPLLARITGTGCMLGALTGTCLAAGDALAGVLLAVLLMGIAGEMAAADAAGPGSCRAGLLDWMYRLTDTEIIEKAELL